MKIINTKKCIIILLIISILLTSFNLAITGLISYAIDDEEAQNEEIEKEELDIEISDFAKNNMQEEKTEYNEKLTINLKEEENIKSILVSDVETLVGDVQEEETEEVVEENEEAEETNIKTFYKTSKINKEKLTEIIKDTGSLKISYCIDETEDQEETTVEQASGIIMAKDGEVSINSTSETDEDGNITIIYPDKTNKIEITFNCDTDEVTEFNIENTKVISKVEDISKVKQMEITKNIIAKDSNEVELVNKEKTVNKSMYYSKTVAELACNKEQISTSIENDVQFTVTLDTEKEIYDLYKNPSFIIELPTIVKNASVSNVQILNNNDTEFTIKESIIGNLENGNQAIKISLTGEQTEHTTKNTNIQMIIFAKIKTESFVPTTTEQIKLHYINEKVKTYDGENVVEDYNEAEVSGSNSINIECVSNKEIMAKSQIIVEGQEVKKIKPNTYNEVTVKCQAINNLGEDVENAVILGKAANAGEILGLSNVYYSENKDATTDLASKENAWKNTYTANAKSYLIVLDNFEQGETVSYEYTMKLDENIEEDTTYKATFAIYNGDKIEKNIETSVVKEVEHLNAFNNDIIKAKIEFSKTENVEIDEIIECTISIDNISEYDVENLSLELDGLNNMAIFYESATIDGETIQCKEPNGQEKLKFINIDIEKNSSKQIKFKVSPMKYEDGRGKINVKILDNNQNDIGTIYEILDITGLVEIEASISSNKENQTLSQGDEIEYTSYIKNTSQSSVTVDITLPSVDGINITKFSYKNSTTNDEKSMSSGNLDEMSFLGVSIGANEQIEVKITGIAKELKKDAIATMYLTVSGTKIEDTITNKLINNVNKKLEEEQQQYEEKETDSNKISGIAWIDENKNGKIDEGESILADILVILKDAQTSEEISRQKTNEKGEYCFENIPNGKYIVEFKYDKDDLEITEYKNENASDEEDSDVLEINEDGETISKTDIIDVDGSDDENANAGFVTKDQFDLNLNKTITKVVVNNDQGTTTTQFDKTNMGKVEIGGKYIKGSIIMVEYAFDITNNGDLAGYAKLIKDEMPEDMEFSSELNPDWYEGNDGNIYSAALVNTKIMPDETKTVKLILTKEMKDDKVTTLVNNAKIEDTYNEYLAKEKDLSNDKSEATLIISLKTGERVTYIILILISITIISIGTYGAIKITKADSDINILNERRK